MVSPVSWRGVVSPVSWRSVVSPVSVEECGLSCILRVLVSHVSARLWSILYLGRSTASSVNLYPGRGRGMVSYAPRKMCPFYCINAGLTVVSYAEGLYPGRVIMALIYPTKDSPPTFHQSARVLLSVVSPVPNKECTPSSISQLDYS